MAERPVECSHCKKGIKVIYKEIVGDSIVCNEMCADCPVLQQRLHGQTAPSTAKAGLSETESGLCCGHCRTSLESVKMGGPLGCSECYAVFGDILIAELSETERLPPGAEAKKNQPLHIGKALKKPLTIPSSSRLTALNEALNEALKKENYEQAAWIRDQIKEIGDGKE